jgi:type IV secretion system protein VirB4
MRLHRVASVVDGRRFVMSCDEFRAYLLNPMFAAVVDKFLLTVRKNNGTERVNDFDTPGFGI